MFVVGFFVGVLTTVVTMVLSIAYYVKHGGYY